MCCPDCGYVFQPWENACPRCQRQQRARASLPSPAVAATPPQPGTAPLVEPAAVSASPTPPVAPAADNAPPNASKQTRLVTRLSVANAWLVALVALLSVACIYLSGIVIGRKMEANREADDPLPLRSEIRNRTNTPVVTPRPAVNHSPMVISPMRDTVNIAIFIDVVGKLEAAKRALLQARHQQESASSGWSNPGAFALPNRFQRVGAASPPQIKQEWERWLQLRQSLNRASCPTPCFQLYSAYHKYLYRVEQVYSDLDRLTGVDGGDPTDSEAALNNMYNTQPALIQQDAAQAERELRNVCLSNNLPKTFTIE